MGSRTDAEDMLQDVWLRVHRVSDPGRTAGFRHGRHSGLRSRRSYQGVAHRPGGSEHLPGIPCGLVARRGCSLRGGFCCQDGYVFRLQRRGICGSLSRRGNRIAAKGRPEDEAVCLGPPTSVVSDWLGRREVGRFPIYPCSGAMALTRMRFRFRQTNQLLADPMEDLSRKVRIGYSTGEIEGSEQSAENKQRTSALIRAARWK